MKFTIIEIKLKTLGSFHFFKKKIKFNLFYRKTINILRIFKNIRILKLIIQRNISKEYNLQMLVILFK